MQVVVGCVLCWSVPDHRFVQQTQRNVGAVGKTLSVVVFLYTRASNFHENTCVEGAGVYT
jgi:hypothetical protein